MKKERKVILGLVNAVLEFMGRRRISDANATGDLWFDPLTHY